MSSPYEYESAEVPAPAPDVSKVVEAKVVVATFVVLVASVAYGIVNVVAEHPDMLDGLPPFVRFAALAAIPPVLVFLAGYRTPSNRVG